MKYHIFDQVILNDQNTYLIVDIIYYQNKKYAFLSDIHQFNTMFVELHDDASLTRLGSKHQELISYLKKIIF